MTGAARAGTNAGLILLFAAGVMQLGFYPAVVFYLIAHMLFLGVRPAWLTLAVAAGAAIVFYGVFDWGLGIPVPRGRLL